jgi:NADH:ubiquinone oxidoreductase subunit 6 (subunit J)
MKRAEKSRVFISVFGITLVLVGLFFILVHQLPFSPTVLIFSGLFIAVLGFTYDPPATEENRKTGFRHFFERYKNPSLVNSEGKKVFQIGAICFFSGLGLGLLTFYLITTRQGQASINQGNPWFFIFLAIAVMLFLSGFILFWLGFVWTRVDMYKGPKKNKGN